MVYAFTENFILPLSHDEVVHGKGSLLTKMPGDDWQRFANLRALYGFMWAHPGKKLLFMGGEIGQWREWSEERSLDWHLLDEADHAGLQTLVRDLNLLLQENPALYEADVEPAGFQWLEADDALENVIAYMRVAPSTQRRIVCVSNLSPVPRNGYRVGMPAKGRFRIVLNTDDIRYGGSGYLGATGIDTEDRPWQYQPYSATINLPPLATLWLEPSPGD